MTFKKVLSFFLTGATALSMTTAAFASDDTVIMLPADVASQDWYAPAVRYVMEYDVKRNLLKVKRNLHKSRKNGNQHK